MFGVFAFRVVLSILSVCLGHSLRVFRCWYVLILHMYARQYCFVIILCDVIMLCCWCAYLCYALGLLCNVLCMCFVSVRLQALYPFRHATFHHIVSELHVILYVGMWPLPVGSVQSSNGVILSQRYLWVGCRWLWMVGRLGRILFEGL